jgi:hypothetical protein
LNYQDFATKPRSEKIILATAEAVDQFKLWTQVEGAVYSRPVKHFIKAVKAGTAHLTAANSTDLVSGDYYFDAKNKTLYVRMLDDSHPKSKDISVICKFFFSNTPVNLPHDLAGGEAVEWEPRIQSIGSLGQQLDDQNTGIVLESSSQLSLINSDGFFDDIFDTIIWENQSIAFYSWSYDLPLSEAYKLFEGVIESKDFSVSAVVFKVKDFVFRLRNKLAMGIFTEEDGVIAPSLIGKPKRRIYGKVKNAKCAGIDNVLSGFAITGMVSVEIESVELIGSGTAFLDELSPGDQLSIQLDNGRIEKLSINSVVSDTLAILGSDSEVSILNKSVINKPQMAFRKKNRRWHIAGHKLHESVAIISTVINSRRFIVDNIDDFFSGDLIEINGQFVSIKRISGKNIILQQSVFPMPVVGDRFEKVPVTGVYFGDKELITGRDWTLINNDYDAIIELSDLAEFNIAPTRSISTALSFVNGSRVISVNGDTDIFELIGPRDWIRNANISTPEWYEVLDIKNQVITLRTAYIGPTQNFQARIKKVDIIRDDSLVTVNTIGKGTSEVPYRWIRTAAAAVRDMVKNDAGFENLDEASFNQAAADCRYTISLISPESIGDDAPAIRDVITKINESVFGSLYGNKSMKIAYSILNARKPIDLEILKDDDILSWSSSSEQKIVNRVRISYRPFIDIYNGSEAFEVVEYVSDFVESLIGIKNTEEKKVYLYEREDATAIAQRIAFYRSLSNCQITMKAKLNLATVTVNDKIYIELERLFKRYSGRDAKKIAIITGTKKNGTDIEINMTDMGNIFNRIACIAPSDLSYYDQATRDEAVRYAFILDNQTLTPNIENEIDLGSNRIG